MEKTFRIGTQAVTISASKEKYISIRTLFDKQANLACRSFLERYKNEIKDFNHLIKEGKNLGISIIFHGLQPITAELISAGIYDATLENFLEKHGESFLSWFSVFEQTIEEKYVDLKIGRQELDNYRQGRKDNRGRLVGGGFGIEGAAKGIAIASAANLASGAMHGIFNSFANAATASRERKELRKIFSADETIKTLAFAVYSDVFNAHFFVFKELVNAGIVAEEGILCKDGENKASRLFENLTEGRIPSGKALEILSLILLEDPYKYVYYRHWLMLFGDENNELSDYAVFHGINIESIKEEILDEMLKDCNTFSSQELTENIYKIKKLENRLGCRSASAASQKCSEYLIEIDNRSRTYEGHIYENSAQAEQAKMEKILIAEKISSCDFDSEKSLEIIFSELSGNEYIYAEADEKIDVLRKQLTELDLAARVLQGTEYSTREEASIARNELAKIENMIKHCGEDTQALSSTLKELQQRSFVLKGTKKIFAEVFKQISQLDKEACTFNGKIYKTIEAAKLAAQAHAEITEEINKVLAGYQTSKNDSFFVPPNLIERKIKLFVQETKAKLGKDIDPEAIIAYYDDTTMGLGDRGMAIAGRYLVITINNIGVIPLVKISRLEIKKMIFGMLTNIIIIQVGSGKAQEFEFKQSTTGVKNFLEIANKIIPALVKLEKTEQL